MIGFFNTGGKHALCVMETEVILADVLSAQKDRPKVDILARQEKKADEPLDLISLVAGTGRKKAQVALVLPLKDFEQVSVTVPPVTREAVTKMLAYRLSKVLTLPVTDYIYDWQVAQQFKDRRELTVYLFSAMRFQQYRQELLARQKEITWFEPDVFAACSYLDSRNDIAVEHTFLILLAWQNSVSIAVYDEQRISVVRAVDLTMPKGCPPEMEIEGPPSPDASSEITLNECDLAENEVGFQIPGESNDLIVDTEVARKDVSTVFELETVGNQHFEGESDVFGILAGFGLQAEDIQPTDVIPNSEEKIRKSEVRPPSAEANLWAEYLENLYLEIMRTGDYHTSVLKGKPVQEVFIGGAEHFYEAMAQTAWVEQNLKLSRFPPDDIVADCTPTLAAICVGALQR